MKRGKIRELAIDTCFNILGSLAMAVGIHCFSVPADIAPGGVSGIAILVRYLSGLPVGLTTFVLNIPLLLLAWRYIGRAFTGRTLATLLISTWILDYVAAPFFPAYVGDRLLSAIFAGAFSGIGLALVFLRGSTTAGTDILSLLVSRRFPHIPIGKMLMLVDGIVLAASVAVFGNMESGLCGLVALFAQAKLIDSIVYGMDKGRTVMVMSAHSGRIAERILEEMGHGATFLEGRGAYSGKKLEVLYVVVRVAEFHQLKRIICEEDPDAFFIAAEAVKIMGEGFHSSQEDGGKEAMLG